MINMSITKDGVNYTLVPITGKKILFEDFIKELIQLNIPNRPMQPDVYENIIDNITLLGFYLQDKYEILDSDSVNYKLNLSVLKANQVQDDLVFEIAIAGKLNLQCINNK